MNIKGFSFTVIVCASFFFVGCASNDSPTLDETISNITASISGIHKVKTELRYTLAWYHNDFHRWPNSVSEFKKFLNIKSAPNVLERVKSLEFEVLSSSELRCSLILDDGAKSEFSVKIEDEKE